MLILQHDPLLNINVTVFVKTVLEIGVQKDRLELSYRIASYKKVRNP
jgi:hypothetical protein